MSFESILIKAFDSTRSDIETQLRRNNKGVIKEKADIDINNKYGRKLNIPGEYENCWEKIGGDLIGEGHFDAFGASVDLSSVIVSDSLKNVTVAVGALGYAAIYNYTIGSEIFSEGEWTQLGDKIMAQEEFDEFGKSISLSSNGRIVAISAPFHDVDGSTFVGHVRIYRLDTESGSGASWTQLGQDMDGYVEGEQFGNSLALSGDGLTVIIGTNGMSITPITRIFRYDETGNIWNLVGGEIAGTAFERSDKSTSISHDGSIVAIGTQYASLTRIFQLVNPNEDATGAWTQIGEDIVGESRSELSGGSVSLSFDGTIVAIGAERNTESNGFAAGHVRVYNFNSATNRWDQLGQDIDGEYATDFSGSSVSLSDDGSTVAIGAWSNDGNGVNAGHVRVYRFESNEWKIYGHDIDGESGGDASGQRLSLSPDGQTVAIGSRGHERSTGHVRIFVNTNENCIITSQPSSKPSSSSVAPTLSPSVSPSDIPSLSEQRSVFDVTSPPTPSPIVAVSDIRGSPSSDSTVYITVLSSAFSLCVIFYAMKSVQKSKNRNRSEHSSDEGSIEIQ